MADVVLINPKSDPSFWGMDYALPFLRRRAAMPPSALPLLAALTPKQYRLRIIDENVEPIDFDSLPRNGIIGITGMSVQRHRMLEVLKELKRRGHFVVVGGAWVTVNESYFNGLADVVFIGEAEESWPRFLADWSQDRFQSRYEQPDKTDMTSVPIPRYELLKMQHYVFGSLQLSRGCPFQCEFCDIIVTFGRKPRVKSLQQILAELDVLEEQHVEMVFIVDDNLIGNKKFIKSVLPHITAWQRRNGFPFIFLVEASLNLAEDDELMRMMLDANILSVFVGIESPNEDSLRETLKLQNISVNGSGSVLDRVRRIQNHGLDVWCGMILGFDNDDASIFEKQLQFLQKARISEAMVGMLYAIPTTPLYSRLAAVGRLDRSDEPEYGTNAIPLRMSREDLRDGYVSLMNELYHPDRYFARLDALFVQRDYRFAPGMAQYLGKHPVKRALRCGKYVVRAFYVYLQLMRNVEDPNLRQQYRKRIAHFIRVHRGSSWVVFYVLRCAMHYHKYTLTQRMVTHEGRLVNSYQ